MVKYLLSSFETAELLYQVVLRYQGNTDEKILKSPSSNQLSKILGVCTPEYASTFSKEVFGSKKPGVSGFGKSPRLLYDMKRSVNDGIPFYIAEGDLFNLLTYIGIDSDKNPYPQMEAKRITNRMIGFEGGCWSLYYFGKEEEPAPTINRAVLQFSAFGRVKIKSPRHDYAGSYQTYGDREYYLYMELKTDPDRDRDLHILVYSGASKQLDLMLGQYHNVEQNIVSGTLILEPSKKEYDQLSPKRINYNDEDYSKIHKSIRDFFNNEHTNKILTSTETMSYEDLARLNAKKNE